MNGKLNTTDLSAGVSKRCGLDLKSSQSFVQELFRLIAEALTTDKLVKVRGLGTFKLLTVEERESVDVRSGERIVIPAHNKLSFTPDPVLRNEVNKPFADFDNVEIGPDVPIETLFNALEEEKEEPGDEAGETEPEVREDTHAEEAKPETEALSDDIQGAGSEEVVDEPQVSENDLSTAPSEPVVTEEEQPLCLEGDSGTENEATDPERPGESYWRMFFFTLLALIAGYIIGGIYPLKELMAMLSTQPVEKTAYIGTQQVTDSVPQEQETPAQTSGAVEAEVQENATAQTDTTEAEVQKSLDTAEEIAAEAEKWPQVEGGEFVIIGEIGKDTMSVGKSLLKISKKYYGSYRYVPYICVLNGIEDPDVVPLNKELRLPKLKRKP